MLRCSRERKPEERGSMRRLPAATSPLPLESTNLRLHRSRDDFEHSSPSMSDAEACGGASRRLSVASREHGPPSAPHLHQTCEGKRVPKGNNPLGQGRREKSVSCVHLTPTLSCKAARRACLTAARWLPRLTLASEGAMCSRRDAGRLCSGHASGSAALSACERS